MSNKCQVLIVEDDFLTQQYLQDMVEDFGYSVCGLADTADQAVRDAADLKPHVVLMDVRLRGKKDGVDAALQIYSDSGTPIIFITGSNEPQTIERIRQDHPAALLIKPLVPVRLKRVLDQVLTR